MSLTSLTLTRSTPQGRPASRPGELPVPALSWSEPDRDGLEHAVIEVPSLEEPTAVERDGYAPGLGVVVDPGGHEVHAPAGNPQLDAIVDAYPVDGMRPGRRTEVASTVRRPDVATDVR